MNKRMDLNDATAIHNMGAYYSLGQLGLPQNHAKALELWHRAAELGNAKSYHNIGNVYKFGRGVEVDEKKATHYYELAAIEGESKARYNLGVMDGNVGNMERALKHFMIAVRDGILIL